MSLPEPYKLANEIESSDSLAPGFVMLFQEFILALIILAYLAFALVLVLRVGATVSAIWKKHKRPERHQTGAKILYFPTATSRQNLSSSEDDRRSEVLRKKAETI